MARTRDKHSKRLLELFARDWGVTVRQAYRLRSAKDERWVSWLASRPDSPAEPPTDDDPVDSFADQEITEDALGVEAEVRRLREECVELARRRSAYRKAGSLPKELSVLRALNATRETLRKIELSSDEIVLKSGSYVQRVAVEHSLGRWLSRITQALDRLPFIAAGRMPADQQQAVRQVVDEELARIRRDLAEIPIDLPGDAGESVKVRALDDRQLQLPGEEQNA